MPSLASWKVTSFERAVLSFITLIYKLYYRIAFPQLFYLLMPRQTLVQMPYEKNHEMMRVNINLSKKG